MGASKRVKRTIVGAVATTRDGRAVTIPPRDCHCGSGEYEGECRRIERHVEVAIREPGPVGHTSGTVVIAQTVNAPDEATARAVAHLIAAHAILLGSSGPWGIGVCDFNAYVELGEGGTIAAATDLLRRAVAAYRGGA